MATDLSAVAVPHSEDITGVSSAEVVTIDPARCSMVRCYIDHADGGTVTLGAGDAVQVAGQAWDTVWIGPRIPMAPGTTTTLTITPTSACDVELRLF